jgi:hypothetical protein
MRRLGALLAGLALFLAAAIRGPALAHLCAFGATRKLNRSHAMLRLIRFLSIFALSFALIPAGAQVYKWVDDRGVTNYASKPPADIKSGAKAVSIAERISVYAPNPAVQRLIDAVASGRERMLSDRIELLERKLARDRELAQYAAAADARAAQAAYEHCLAQRRVDCDYDGAYSPYGAGAVLAVFQRRPPALFPARLRSHDGAETSVGRRAQGNHRRTPRPNQ